MRTRCRNNDINQPDPLASTRWSTIMKVFLNGTAMAGGADHANIKGAPFLGPRQTAPLYHFYAVGDRFPGLVPVDAGGSAIDGELYELEDDAWFNSLLPSEPPELRPPYPCCCGPTVSRPFGFGGCRSASKQDPC